MRYSKLPQQQIINTYTPPNVDFYANILNRAQENLNQAEVMKAKYMEELYNLPTQDPTSIGQYIGGAQDIIQNSLNKPFVSSADTAKAIMKASQYLAPIKALNTLQLQAAQREQQARLAYGAGYIGNSPSKVSLINPATGALVSPQELELIAANAEDFNKSWAQAYGKYGEQERIESTDRLSIMPGSGGQYFAKKDIKVKGLRDAEVKTDFINNKDKINQLMQNNPQLVSALKASGQNPVEWFTNNHNNLSRGLIGGEMDITTPLKNENYVNPTQALQNQLYRKQLDAINNPRPPVPPNPYNPVQSSNIYTPTPDENIPKLKIRNDKYQQLVKNIDGVGYNNFKLEDFSKQSNKILNVGMGFKAQVFTENLKKDFPDLYNTALNMNAPEEAKVRWLLSSVSNLTSSNYNTAMQNNKFKSDNLTMGSWSMGSSTFNTGVKTFLTQNAGLPTTDSKGKDVSLGNLLTSLTPDFKIKDNGNLMLFAKDGKQYEVHMDRAGDIADELDGIIAPNGMPGTFSQYLSALKAMNTQRYSAVPLNINLKIPDYVPINNGGNIYNMPVDLSYEVVPSGDSTKENMFRKVYTTKEGIRVPMTTDDELYSYSELAPHLLRGYADVFSIYAPKQTQ